MDELVELLELLLVVDFLGVGRNSAQAIHDVVLHKHGGIAAHGKGNGVAVTDGDRRQVQEEIRDTIRDAVRGSARAAANNDDTESSASAR